MDFLNLFSANQSGRNSTGMAASEAAPMNSLFQQSSRNQTYAKEGDNVGIMGGLLVAFVVLCVFVVRKLQNA